MRTVLTYVDAAPGERLYAKINDIEYFFTVTDYSENSGFATINITNTVTKDCFVSYGQSVVDGHLITSRWESEYNENRDNYVHNKNLIITIQ